jgi:hypothetical protein
MLELLYKFNDYSFVRVNNGFIEFAVKSLPALLMHMYISRVC